IAEVVSVLVRKRNAGQLAPAAVAQALLDFGTEIVDSVSVRKDVAQHALVTAALLLIQAHSINGTDAIILRSALDLATALRPPGLCLPAGLRSRRRRRAGAQGPAGRRQVAAVRPVSGQGAPQPLPAGVPRQHRLARVPGPVQPGARLLLLLCVDGSRSFLRDG